LQDSALQVAESFQLVAPSIRQHISEHECKSPPKESKEQNKRANVCDHIQGALNIGEELKEWDQEADQ
jgi:hypothetical protein